MGAAVWARHRFGKITPAMNPPSPAWQLNPGVPKKSPQTPNISEVTSWGRTSRRPPWAQHQRTFGRQKVDEHGHGGDEDAGHDDVDDVEEGLALDDEVEDHLLVLGVIWGEMPRIDDFPRGAVLDGPLAVLCHAGMPPGESSCPFGDTASPQHGWEDEEGWARCGERCWGHDEGAGEGDAHRGVLQNTPESYRRGKLMGHRGSLGDRGSQDELRVGPGVPPSALPAGSRGGSRA